MQNNQWTKDCQHNAKTKDLLFHPNYQLTTTIPVNKLCRQIHLFFQDHHPDPLNMLPWYL